MHRLRKIFRVVLVKFAAIEINARIVRQKFNRLVEIGLSFGNVRLPIAKPAISIILRVVRIELNRLVKIFYRRRKIFCAVVDEAAIAVSVGVIRIESKCLVEVGECLSTIALRDRNIFLIHGEEPVNISAQVAGNDIVLVEFKRFRVKFYRVVETPLVIKFVAVRNLLIGQKFFVDVAERSLELIALLLGGIFCALAKFLKPKVVRRENFLRVFGLINQRLLVSFVAVEPIFYFVVVDFNFNRRRPSRAFARTIVLRQADQFKAVGSYRGNFFFGQSGIAFEIIARLRQRNFNRLVACAKFDDLLSFEFIGNFLARRRVSFYFRVAD